MSVHAGWPPTSVQRPCLMMSVQGITLAALAVNGAAIDASPGLSCAAGQGAAPPG
jgi:hypothetical protein